VASIGNGAAFRKGREFAAWLGLLPNQHSTGGKVRLYGISKRGNSYLRKILIHGARAVVLRSKRDRIAMGAWMTSLETRAPQNVLIVATAHKLARIAWAVRSTGPRLSSSTRGTDSISRLSNQQQQVLPTEVFAG
jgi:transposase